MLMKWGTEIADSLGLRGFVQASQLGEKHLYSKHGFVDKNNEGFLTVTVSEKHKNRPAIRWFNLERPAKDSISAEAKDSI